MSADARREIVGPLQSTVLDTEPDTLPALIAATLAWLSVDAAEARDVITVDDPR